MLVTTNILITGVARGLGRALIETYLLRSNHFVIGTVRNLNAPVISELKALPTGPGSQLLLLEVDLSTIESATVLSSALETNKISHIDVVIANAVSMGSKHSAVINDVTPTHLTECFEVNTRGTLIIFQATRDLLKKAKEPKWVSMSTVSASLASINEYVNHFSAYGISKAGKNWITRAVHISNEWLTAFAIHPGFVQTEGGNISAQELGLAEAFDTVEKSTKSIVDFVDGATRENTSGKFFNTLTLEEIPW